MALINVDPFGWIPDPLKKQMMDGLIGFISDQAKKYVGDGLSDTLDKLKSDAGFNRKFNHAIRTATTRFESEYALVDEDLTAAITKSDEIWKTKSVRNTLLQMIKHPGRWEEKRNELDRKFDDLLPSRLNRERVNQAVTFFLNCLIDELWHLPELHPIYDLYLQKITAEKAVEMVEELKGLREDFYEAINQLVRRMVDQNKLLASRGEAEKSTAKILHNLPQPDFERFVGRTDEIRRLKELLHPEARTWVIVIDGIGGIGKSALALEIAHQYLKLMDQLGLQESFKAIIWTSAKTTMFTADGVVARQQVVKTLSDIYRTILLVLGQDELVPIKFEDQGEFVRRALIQHRTLLIIDNLETIDDEQVNSFIRELPAPTKCIVTTRHRIDVAYPIRLTGLSNNEGLDLIYQESMKKGVVLTPNQARLLNERTGSVPLAIVWSIAQIGFGHSVEQVLHRLGFPTSDIAAYCFESALSLIRGRPAHFLLAALALKTRLSRAFLGKVINLSDLDRDDGLVELEKLSLVNKQQDIFDVLPLVGQYALNELKILPQEEVERMIIVLTDEYYGSEPLLRACSILEVSSEVKEKAAKAIDSQMWGYAQAADEQSVYYFLEELSKIETITTISTLKWVAEGGLSGYLVYSQDTYWTSEYAIPILIRLKQNDYLLKLYEKNPDFPSELFVPKALGKYGDSNTLSAVDEYIKSTTNGNLIAPLQRSKEEIIKRGIMYK